MSENTELTVHRPLTPSVWQMIADIAPAMHKSRLYGVNSPEAAAAIMLKGYEIGLGLSASFEFIDVIQGRPVLKPRGMLALLHDHPDCAGLEVEDIVDDKGQPEACRVYMKRRNGFEYTVTFSMEDAKKADLIKKDSAWQKYPANMLRWRAIGFCADVVFPDILGGMKRADELGAAIDEEGDVIEGSYATVSATEEDESVARKLDALAELYGADAVLEVGGGSLPTTMEEADEVAMRLAEAAQEEEE